MVPVAPPGQGSQHALLYFNQKKNAEPVLATQIAQFLNVSRANITSHLNALQEKSLIVQLTHGNDRRKRLLDLTQKGEDVVKSLNQERETVGKKLFSTFSHREKEQFLEYLQRCFKQMSIDI